jgi:bla regulator protein blaR1
MSFLEMSLMGGAMILCILLLRMILGDRLPAVILSTMWAAAVLRLLLPVTIPSPISMMAFVKGLSQPNAMTLPARAVPNTVSISPFVLIWLCGAALCALFFLVAYLGQRRVLKTALPATMTMELKAALHDQHLVSKVAVFTSDRISTPMTYGLKKPRIVLPSHMKLYGQELNFVIAHECGHILRRDTAKKCVLLFAVCLHWFNPLVWLMAAMCRRDMELDCDRRVLKACGHNARANYAKTLLCLEERKRFSGMVMECLSVSPLEERIRSIMSGKKATLSSALASIAVYFCAAAVFATSPGALPSVTASSVWITTVPLNSYDTRQLNASEAAVYVMSGDVLAAGQTGLLTTAPYITVSSLKSQDTLSETAASVSVNYGGAIAVATENAVVPAIAMPVYSMTYTLKDSGIQH